jgi:hypothetical protein
MHQDADTDITILKIDAPVREIRESCRGLCHDLWPGNGGKVRFHETTSIFAIPCRPKGNCIREKNQVYEVFNALTPGRT